MSVPGSSGMGRLPSLSKDSHRQPCQRLQQLRCNDADRRMTVTSRSGRLPPEAAGESFLSSVRTTL
jgi:hypothetical protein